MPLASGTRAGVALSFFDVPIPSRAAGKGSDLIHRVPARAPAMPTGLSAYRGGLGELLRNDL